MTSPPRQRLLETALALFHREGFHATGIDRVLNTAGVAKMTLYNHFKSKEALALAVLQLRDERFRAWLSDAVANRADTPAGQLSALFDALEEWFHQPGFHGCLFINAAAEYGADDNPIHEAASHHKAEVLNWLTALAQEAGAREPERLATALAVLKDGLIVQAQVLGPRSPATANALSVAADIGRRLIAEATGQMVTDQMVRE